ncbi:hypothetical protein SAMN05661093_10719 [Kibdelosporangium aridum]|uniref:Uncharacterized protein n=1 Tax=Kibdelosporangium aridum TaxID=2030 RepID=A0A1Y5YCQ4_KIBAR|nr:hypothetical protein SAMN05661093_10719 [Kibdelosporangium aridum]
MQKRRATVRHAENRPAHPHNGTRSTEVHFGHTPRPDNVFDEIEYPKLEEQGIKVTEHNAETGATRPYQKPPSVKP